MTTQVGAESTGLNDLTGQVVKTGAYAFASGGFADIWRGTWESPAEETPAVNVAIKIIRHLPIDEEKMQTKFMRELKVWSILRHEHIVPLLGVVNGLGPFASLVSPYMANGNAQAYFKGQDIQDTMSQRLKVLADVASGLKFLHTFSPKVIHGDLKAANVLINDHGSAVLSDFGLSKTIEDISGATHFTMTSFEGSTRWMAPELLAAENDSNAHYTTASDVWAYASTVLEVITGQIPYYYLKRDAQVILSISQGSIPNFEECIPSDVWLLLQICWSGNQRLRPSISQVRDAMGYQPRVIVEADEGEREGTIDILFVQDATASQEPYIACARSTIYMICRRLRNLGNLRKGDGLQFGLLTYRDYPQVDTEEFVTESYGFTYDLKKMKNDLISLKLEGGGDGPEALSQALDDALNMDGWRKDSTKVIVIITDSPPHGLEKWCDAFPKGAPEGCKNPDPLELSREFAKRGIMLVFLTCDPDISNNYWYTADLYKAMAKISAGIVYPLGDSMLPALYIISSLSERTQILKLSRQYKVIVAYRYFTLSEPIGKILKDYSSINPVPIGYEDIPVSHETRYNALLFLGSDNLNDTRLKRLRRNGGRQPSPSCLWQRGSKQSVTVIFRNTGSERNDFQPFRLNIYSSTRLKLLKKTIGSNCLYPVDFLLDEPYNFILEHGGTSKIFSWRFNSSQDVDLVAIFSQN